MYSVVGRVRNFKQPRGGYLSPTKFEKTILEDGIELNQTENIGANLVGMAVDYLARFMTGTPIKDAFSISLLGSSKANEESKAEKLLSNIIGLDDKSIINACKMVGYDVCYRVGIGAFISVDEIQPNAKTIENIRIMVNRCVAFLRKYGPVVLAGFDLKGGYTDIISSGDGDYITEDTLWELKVSAKPPRNIYTLQLLVYYLMGCRSVHNEFQNIKKLGIFNPRLNVVYRLDISDIDNDVIKSVSSDVIGYE